MQKLWTPSVQFSLRSLLVHLLHMTRNLAILHTSRTAVDEQKNLLIIEISKWLTSFTKFKSSGM